MSFWDTLGHFFSHLFPYHAKEAQSLLTEISPYVNLAGPIVRDIETDLKPALTEEQGQKADALNAFLQKYLHQEQDLQTKVSQLLGLPTADIWRDTAETILALVLPATVDKSLLNLIIETAYQLYVRRAQPNSASALPAPASAPAAA